MATLDTVPTPKMTFIPQSGSPELPVSGLLALFVSVADKHLYLVDNNGTIYTITPPTPTYAPISNSNHASPDIFNAAGGRVLTRRF